MLVEALLARPLVARVATVNDDVGAGHEAGGVGGEEDAEAVELVNSTQALLRSQGLPDLLLGLEGGDTVEGSVHVAGGDAVDTDLVLGPLGGDGLGELDDTGLGGVVAALLLGVVDNGAGHGGDHDQAAGLASGHHGAANGLGHQEGTSEVDVDQTTEHGRVVGLSLDVGVGNTGSVDENIRGAVELDNGVDGGVDGSAVTDVDLEEGNGQTRLLVQLSGGGVAQLLVGIEDDDGLGTGLSTGAGHVVAQAASTTGDNDDLALDGHGLKGVRHLVVDLLAQGLNLIALSGGGAVVGDLGGALGDLQGGLVALAGTVVGDGDLLLADNALLVGGVRDADAASGREEADGVAGGSSAGGGGEVGGARGAEYASSREGHCDCVCVCVFGWMEGVLREEGDGGEMKGWLFDGRERERVLKNREGRTLRYKQSPERESRREIACGKAVWVGMWYAERGEMEMAAFDQVEACLDIAMELDGWGRQTWGKAEKRKNGEGRWISGL